MLRLLKKLKEVELIGPDKSDGGFILIRYKYLRKKNLGYLKYCSISDDLLLVGEIKVNVKRKGFGTLLFKKLIECARVWGIETIYGNIVPYNEINHKFYTSLGCQIGEELIKSGLKIGSHQFKYQINRN